MTYSYLIDRDTELNKRSVLIQGGSKSPNIHKKLTPYRGPWRVVIQVETILIQPDSVVEQHPSHLCGRATSMANTSHNLTGSIMSTSSRKSRLSNWHTCITRSVTRVLKAGR